MRDFELKKGDVVRLKPVAWLQDMAYRNVYLYDGKFGYLSQWLTDDVLKLAGGRALVTEVIVHSGNVRWVKIVTPQVPAGMIISDLLIESVIGDVENPHNQFAENSYDDGANLELSELFVPDKSSTNDSSWNTQISGDHYSKLPIQPMIFSMKNKLTPLQHNVIKYVVRYKDKNGKVDLEKAIHCLQLLIDLEYPE